MLPPGASSADKLGILTVAAFHLASARYIKGVISHSVCGRWCYTNDYINCCSTQNWNSFVQIDSVFLKSIWSWRKL